jgi:hypothetical protein
MQGDQGRFAQASGSAQPTSFRASIGEGPRSGLARRWALLAPPVLVAFAWATDPALAQSPMEEGRLRDRVQQILAERCARTGCHAGPAPQMGMDLSPESFFDATVNRASRERPALMRVAPGRPEESYLLMKVRGDPGIEGGRMPLFGEPLAGEDVEAIERWIRALPVEVPEEEAAPSRPVMAFPGWKIVNLPSTRALDGGLWLFLIGHRFNPPLDTGYDTFFGLDGAAIIYLSLGYAVTDELLLALGRTNASDVVDLRARYVLLRQRGGAFPAAVALEAGLEWTTERAAGQSRISVERLSPALELSLTRATPGGRAALAVVPGVLWNPMVEEERVALFTLGVGGRVRLSERLAAVGEWIPILAGFSRSRIFGNDLRFDSWGAGLEILTAGHVFQIVLGNSLGMTAGQYMRGGDLDIRAPQARLGFNIFRALDF